MTGPTDDLTNQSHPVPRHSNGEAKDIHISQPDDLHNLIAVAGTEDEEDPLAALRNDPNYAALIGELEYIAKQARLLFEPAAEAPSDEVWTKIESQLHAKSNA